MASFTRRTLTRTSALILSSLSRMVPQVAVANWVWTGIVKLVPGRLAGPDRVG